jgi:hypothetical protein
MSSMLARADRGDVCEHIDPPETADVRIAANGRTAVSTERRCHMSSLMMLAIWVAKAHVAFTVVIIIAH